MVGGPYRQRADRIVHGDQAALARRARARQCGPRRRGAAAARLAQLAARAGRRGRAGHRPWRRVRHRLLLAVSRPLAARPGRGSSRPSAVPAPDRAAPRDRRTDRVGRVLSAGTGDNMGAALGLGLEPGRRGRLDRDIGHGLHGQRGACRRRRGAVAGFADATGRFLPLVCTINAGLVLSATAALLDADLDGLVQAGPRGAAGAGGITLLPYLDGERTPDRPTATGVLRGLTTRNMTRENLARSAVEAVLASLAEAADLLAAACGVPRRRVLLIGGAARSEAVCRIAPGPAALCVVVSRARGVRCDRRGAPGRVGAGRHRGPAALAASSRRGVRRCSAVWRAAALRIVAGGHLPLGGQDGSVTAGPYAPARGRGAVVGQRMARCLAGRPGGTGINGAGIGAEIMGPWRRPERGRPDSCRAGPGLHRRHELHP